MGGAQTFLASAAVQRIDDEEGREQHQRNGRAPKPLLRQFGLLACYLHLLALRVVDGGHLCHLTALLPDVGTVEELGYLIGHKQGTVLTPGIEIGAELRKVVGIYLLHVGLLDKQVECLVVVGSISPALGRHEVIVRLEETDHRIGTLILTELGILRRSRIRLPQTPRLDGAVQMGVAVVDGPDGCFGVALLEEFANGVVEGHPLPDRLPVSHPDVGILDAGVVIDEHLVGCCRRILG